MTPEANRDSCQRLVREANADRRDAYGIDTPKNGALPLGASAIRAVGDLTEIYEFFHTRARAPRPHSRIAIGRGHHQHALRRSSAHDRGLP